MTIAVLRSLHEIIGNAIDDIERVYATHADDLRSGPSSKSSSPAPTCPQAQPQTSPESQCGCETTRTASEAPQSPPTHLSSPSNSAAYVSPPPSPSVATTPSTPLVSSSSNKSSTCGKETQIPAVDFPTLDALYDGGSLSEALTTHPRVLAAIGRIVAAAGQLGAMVQTPFLTLCEAVMAYHLPSCMRLLEASHVVEILREAGPEGLSVQLISQKNGVAPNKLAHVLRLLATHHLLREVSPDVFTLNRLSSLVDSGKTFEEIKRFEKEGRPEMKYTDTNGIAAFVGLCTDEIQKSAAYMTETYYLSPSASTRAGADPVRAPFCFAFDTVRSGTGFFGWLEGEARPPSGGEGTYGRPNQQQWALPQRASSARHAQDRAISARAGQGAAGDKDRQGQVRKKLPPASASDPALHPSPPRADSETTATQEAPNPNRFRLVRFGKAMSGTDGWEVPGAVLSGFDWASLPCGSVVVDVGGGIGSTSMILATAFSQEGAEGGVRGFKFIIQDRAVVCEMGEKAWKAKCPELLGATVKFQVHDFFAAQPVKDAAVFLLRVVLHDWPDDFARKILLHLREAATPDTKLLIADFVLPLACPDDTSSTGVLEGVEGAESVLAPAPLLPNLGKASSNVYWMDLTMQVMFNSLERTLREMVALTLSAGWKVVKVTKTPGSLFGYLVAVPVAIPIPETPCVDTDAEKASPEDEERVQTMICSDADKKDTEAVAVRRTREHEERYRDMELIQRSSSRCGTPTFGSRMRLSSASETLSRFGNGTTPSKVMSRTFSSPIVAPRSPPGLKPALTLSASAGPSKKKKPSPLSVPPATIHVHSSPTPAQSPRGPPSASTSPKTESPKPPRTPAPSATPRTIARRMSLAALRSPHAHSQHMTLGPPPPLPASPKTPSSTARTLTRRASQGGLAAAAAARGMRSPVPPLPSLIPVRTGATACALAGSGAAGVDPVSPSSSSSHRSPHSPRAPASPGLSGAIPTRTIARRASVAQLPHAMAQRKRAGTIATAAFSGTGTVLRFDAPDRPDLPVRAFDGVRRSDFQSPLSCAPSVGALAAAARISESGERHGDEAHASP